MSNKQINALNELLKLEQDARDFGFEWPDAMMILEQVMAECAEIKQAIEHNESRERIQEEIGDLLHSAVSLCDFAGFEVEETIAKVNQKFGRRMQAVKAVTQETGLANLKGQPIDVLMDIWQKAKLRNR